MKRRQLLKGIGATGLLALGVGSAQADWDGITLCSICVGDPCPDHCDMCDYVYPCDDGDPVPISP